VVRPQLVNAPLRKGLARRVIPALVVLVVALLGLWIAAGLVFSALRVLELVVVAAVSAWVGYHAGVYKGRHERR